MKKRLTCWILVVALLIPVSAVAAASTDDLARQIDTLTEQLNELKKQLEQVQDASESTSETVAELQVDVEKSKEEQIFQFSGDYRFRMDYSDADTPAYWGADAVAGAVADMNRVTGMEVEDILGLMGSYGAQERQGMIENLPDALAGMMASNPTSPFYGDMAAAQAYVASVGVANGYSLTPENNYKNDILYTNRLRLNILAKASENLQFKGRLAMYKAWGMQSNPTATGPYLFNSFTEMDGATTRQPADSVLRVDRAYINWTGVGDLPVWVSVGRRPTTDGPPEQLRQGLEQRMATPVSFMNYAFDGATIGVVFQNPFEFMGYSKLRFCYGRGFEAGPNDTGNDLNDMDFGGISWDLINKDSRFMNIQSFLAANIVNIPDGVRFANPLEMALDTGDGYLDRENIGNIYHTSFVYMDKIAHLNYFLAGGWSRTDPSGFDEMGTTLLGSWWDDPGAKDGYGLYGGVRYDISGLGLKLGLEYNYGSKNWISMTPAHDDMTQAKLATRGHVGEIYLIKDLPVGRFLSDRAKAFVRLGYQHYEYDYTGSGSWLGAPVDLDDLNDPLNAQFFAPIDSMDQLYLTMEAYF